MSSNEQNVINIRANSKRNGLVTVLLGILGLGLSVMWLSFAPESLFLAGIFLTSAAIVTLLIGWFKLREPEFSLAITPAEVRYFHRLGKWQLSWDNVQRVDCPRIRRGIEHQELEAVGFKLKDYSPFLRGISPRLATHILMEQRPLLLQRDEDNCQTGMCYGNDMFDDKPVVLENGEQLTGVKAMLANRMSQLRDRLGFDVYISTADLDRSATEFATLLKQCQQSQASRNEQTN
ncbi:DUF2982 domain-containing protein [Alteromonas sp. ASW11-130]|uniref:DUF2982 domain-containing protein n=1 Tax=Alteromonas sp. ASW11-130 TaxID=3015775 RepID=UPI0022420057|nr:DUF2982 domain-containing protein [Alteromonas sp. ASW11-130]MCW8090960.1 DUF2982 domain-containing protein [Alteromonas sp. ASW11-130]